MNTSPIPSPVTLFVASNAAAVIVSTDVAFCAGTETHAMISGEFCGTPNSISLALTISCAGVVVGGAVAVVVVVNDVGGVTGGAGGGGAVSSSSSSVVDARAKGAAYMDTVNVAPSRTSSTVKIANFFNLLFHLL